MHTAQEIVRGNECIWYDKYKICSLTHTKDGHCTISVQDLLGNDNDEKEDAGPYPKGGDLR